MCLHKGRFLSSSQKRGAFLVFLEISGESFHTVYLDVSIWALPPNSFSVKNFTHKYQDFSWSLSGVWGCPCHYALILCVTFNGVLQWTVGWLNYSSFYFQGLLPTSICFYFQNLHFSNPKDLTQPNPSTCASLPLQSTRWKSWNLCFEYRLVIASRVPQCGLHRDLQSHLRALIFFSFNPLLFMLLRIPCNVIIFTPIPPSSPSKNYLIPPPLQLCIYLFQPWSTICAAQKLTAKPLISRAIPDANDLFHEFHGDRPWC